VEGIARVTTRISELEDRLAQFASFAPVSVNGQGWAPGLSGAGQPRNVYNATALQSPTDRGEVKFSDTMIAAEVAVAQASAPAGSAAAGGDPSVGAIAPGAIGGTQGTDGLNNPVSSIPPFSPPPELLAYGNGNIPSEALGPIGVGSHRLWGPAAKAFMNMRADAAAAGIDIGVTDSYRSYAQQVDLAERKGLYRDGGLAAVPGTSKHGWGVALDLDVNAKAQEWLRANATRYGFYETTPREPWHWEFRDPTAPGATSSLPPLASTLPGIGSTIPTIPPSAISGITIPDSPAGGSTIPTGPISTDPLSEIGILDAPIPNPDNNF
jgi:zinc D-Ala-D-Ala carboxypeptidase